jgi:hypothetical protein
MKINKNLTKLQKKMLEQINSSNNYIDAFYSSSKTFMNITINNNKQHNSCIIIQKNN